VPIVKLEFNRCLGQIGKFNAPQLPLIPRPVNFNRLNPMSVREFDCGEMQLQVAMYPHLHVCVCLGGAEHKVNVKVYADHTSQSPNKNRKRETTETFFFWVVLQLRPPAGT